MNKKQIQRISALMLGFVTISLIVLAQPDAGVSAVLDPPSGSTLVIGSTFPVTAQVFNSGTTTITSMQLKFNIGINNSNTALDEIWNGSLAPGDTMTYVFNAQFTLTDISNSSAFCLADATGDNNVGNNSVNPVYYFSGTSGLPGYENTQKDAFALDQFLVNPGAEVKAVVNAGAGTCIQATIIDMGGRLILSKSATYWNHYDEITFDISKLQPGLYVLVVQNEFSITARKFVR